MGDGITLPSTQDLTPGWLAREPLDGWATLTRRAEPIGISSYWCVESVQCLVYGKREKMEPGELKKSTEPLGMIFPREWVCGRPIRLGLHSHAITAPIQKLLGKDVESCCCSVIRKCRHWVSLPDKKHSSETRYRHLRTRDHQEKQTRPLTTKSIQDRTRRAAAGSH